MDEAGGAAAPGLGLGLEIDDGGALARVPRRRTRCAEAARPSGPPSCRDIFDVGASQPTVSHHVKRLQDAGLLSSERAGFPSRHRAGRA